MRNFEKTKKKNRNDFLHILLILRNNSGTSDASAPLGRLYTFCISHITGISRMFSQNTHKIRNTRYTLSYFMRISCFINAAKNKPQNPLTFRANADPDVKCEECKKGREKSDAKYPAIYTFRFRILRSILHISQ